MQNLRSHAAFTLVEILIVIAILVSLSSLVLFSSLKTTLKKGRDAKRKQDLNKLVRYMEDYYNDHDRYPPADEAMGSILDAPWGGSFANFGSNLPQDPLSPSRQYYYQTDTNAGNMFIVYTRLESESDEDINRTGCTGGCGPNRAYNYAIYSSNVVIVDGQPVYQGSVLGLGDSFTHLEPTTKPSPLTHAGCQYDQCGYCTDCGGKGGQTCGYLSRCLHDGIIWGCRFDMKCMQ